MSDIVAELRAGADDFCADGPCWPGDVMIEAAMEIERLRAENAEKETMLLNQAKTIKEMQAENEALSEPSLQADVDRLRVALARIEHECIIRQPATAVRTVKDVRAIARQALAAKWKALNVASPIGEK